MKVGSRSIASAVQFRVQSDRRRAAWSPAGRLRRVLLRLCVPDAVFGTHCSCADNERHSVTYQFTCERHQFDAFFRRLSVVLAGRTREHIPATPVAMRCSTVSAKRSLLMEKSALYGVTIGV